MLAVLAVPSITKIPCVRRITSCSIGTVPVLVKLIGVRLHAASNEKSASGETSFKCDYLCDVLSAHPNSEVAVNTTCLSYLLLQTHMLDASSLDMPLPDLKSQAVSHILAPFAYSRLHLVNYYVYEVTLSCTCEVSNWLLKLVCILSERCITSVCRLARHSISVAVLV